VLTKECPQCAEAIKLEAHVCKYCGHKFDLESIVSELETVMESPEVQTSLHAIDVLVKQLEHGWKVNIENIRSNFGVYCGERGRHTISEYVNDFETPID